MRAEGQELTLALDGHPPDSAAGRDGRDRHLVDRPLSPIDHQTRLYRRENGRKMHAERQSAVRNLQPDATTNRRPTELTQLLDRRSTYDQILSVEESEMATIDDVFNLLTAVNDTTLGRIESEIKAMNQTTLGRIEGE